MLKDEQVQEFSPMVAQIANEYARKYRMIDANDIRQELWLWFVSHPNKIRDWAKKEIKESTAMFARSLRNAAHDYCVKEKARIVGYEPEDNFWYNKQLIKALLPAALSSDWKRVERLSGDVKATKSPAESGDWMAFAADVKAAFQKLSEEEQVLVYNFYAKDTEGSDLHDKFGGDRPSAGATMMSANRALNKMVKTLGGIPPFRDTDYPDERADQD